MSAINHGDVDCQFQDPFPQVSIQDDNPTHILVNVSSSSIKTPTLFESNGHIQSLDLETELSIINDQSGPPVHGVIEVSEHGSLSLSQGCDSENKTDEPMDFGVAVAPEETTFQSEVMELRTDSESQNQEKVEDSPTDVLEYFWIYNLNSKSKSTMSARTTTVEFPPDCCLKGCKWAPDGSCLLTNSDDSTIRIFNLPEAMTQVSVSNWDSDANNPWTPALKVREGGQVYDYCWYPFMYSSDPQTSCFLTTSANNPIHLWDAFTGELRCTYRAYNAVDEVTAAHSVAFNSTGQKIYSGFDKTVRIFDISRPGRECVTRTLKNAILPDLRQPGIISCITASPYLNIYACGSFGKTVGVYAEDGTVMCILEGHTGGLTHLMFSHDGTKLFSGGRKDKQIICWDLRNIGDKYKVFERVVETNQRIYFDLTKDDRFLVSGGTDGQVKCWDVNESNNDTTRSCSWEFSASTDCVSGVSLNPFLPLLATSSGQRHFDDIADSDDDELFIPSKSRKLEDRSVKLWKLS